MFVSRNRRKLLLLLLICICWLLVLSGCGQEAADKPSLQVPGEATLKQMEELNRTADELYRLATTEQYEKARESVIRFGEQVAASTFSGITGVEGIDALSDTVVEAKKQFNAVRPDKSGMVKAAAQLKLTSDALTHPKQPMWLQYEKVLAADADGLARAVSTGDQPGAEAAAAKLKEHYSMIRPAVWVSRQPEVGEQMDSLLAFFTKYTQAPHFQQDVLGPGVEQWKEAVHSLFHSAGDRTAYLPLIQPDQPILWTFTVGSLIVTVLGYSAWRMFHTDRSVVKLPRPRKGDAEA